MRHKGQLFAMELIFVTITIFLVIFTVITLTANVSNKNRLQKEQIELQRTAIFLTDSLIKNTDITMPLTGSAFKNQELKRTEPNIIDLDLLERTQNLQIDNKTKIKKISLKTKKLEEKTVFENTDKKNTQCTTIERFIIVQKTKQKALLSVKTCYE